MTGRPFDAVLVIAFGGPEGPADIRPFLANVLRGRRVPAGRVEAVAKHYELFGSVSPRTAIASSRVRSFSPSRKGSFEGPATVKPPALPGDCYFNNAENGKSD